MFCDASPAHFDALCSCGHMRRDHADMFSRCDDCSCRKFIGEIPPMPVYNMYGPYGYVGPYIPLED